MNILGLHFGHDAATAVVRDGHVASYVLRERRVRVKHAISLRFQDIEEALAAAGIRWQEVDYCVITSTQTMEIVCDDPRRFALSFAPHPGHVLPCSFAEIARAKNIDVSSLLVQSLFKILYEEKDENSLQYRCYRHYFPEHRRRAAADFYSFPWLDNYVESSLWRGGTLEEIAATDFSEVLDNDAIRFGFHYPVTVRCDGRDLPGYFVNHHLAHAASTYYQSRFTEAAILTHDGFTSGLSYFGGLLLYAQGNRLYPLTPHHLTLGVLYTLVGLFLNLGEIGPPGKLMGLAAYGQPRFFDRAFVGNWYDWTRANKSFQSWMEHCLRLARGMGYDMKPIGQREQMMAPINVDIAASTQKLFEETMLRTAEILHQILEKAGRPCTQLCVSGGTALNCPTNGRLFREGRFQRMYVEPGCDDSGLAVGAALYLHHNVLDRPLPAAPAGPYATPYLGGPIKEGSIRAALEAVKDKIDYSPSEDAAAAAAADLAADKIVGWFEGRSEIGPRALGHRSILADPRPAQNWPRVNQIKGREPWRPFAPAVLESEAAQWFRGTPIPSPYMLFTGTVRSSLLPAITHADGSARLQTVDPSCGEFYRVVLKFFEKTGVPVVLNTSFNGPGEPIVETPEDAVSFLLKSELDVLYLGGFRVQRREALPNQTP